MKLDLLKRGIYIAILTITFSCQGERSSLEKDMYQKLQSIKTADKANQQIAGFDSLALSLVDYYEHRGSKLKLAEAYYYAGRVFYEQRDFPKSLHYYNKAASALPTSDNLELEGIIYSQMGYVFSLQDLSEEAISAFNQSYQSCKNQKDTLGMIYGLRDMGTELSTRGRYEEAKQKLKESIQLAKAKGLDYMYYGTKSNLASLYSKLHDYPKARAEIGEALSCIYGPDSSGVLTTAANIYMKLGMIDSVEYYSKQLLDIGTIYARRSANERLAEIALRRNQPKEAMCYMKVYKELNDSIVETTTTETVAKINALYNYQRQEQENATLREINQRANFRLIIVVFMILILVLIYVAAYFYYRKQKETKGLKSELFEQFKKWQQTQEEKTKTEERQRAMQKYDICKKFKRLVDDDGNMTTQITDDDWKELEQAVNSVYPSFTGTLEKHCNINTCELKVCLLRKIDVSPTKTAIIMNKSKQAINSIRERLHQKALGQKGTPAQWDDYLQSL
ncbi:MAG: hypothetical protein Q4E48_02515 [Prevotella sp.]|nr:hypothetical protein [Prevotella sp.]